MTDNTPTPISKAERRRASREAAQEVPEEANPEAVPEADEETTSDRAVAIGEVVRDYGNVLADLSRSRKIPVQTGVKLLEIVLQYDVQRRNLALQEASLIQGMNFPPPGAVVHQPDPDPETPAEE